MSFFYRMGIWSRLNEETVREKILKIFYTFYFPLGISSLITGAIATDDDDERIFLTQISINCMVLQAKLLYLIWRKSEILEILNRVCCYDVNDHEELIFINNMLENLLTFTIVVFGAVNFSEFTSVVIVPIQFHDEKKLFFNIGFPLDTENDEFAYWLADIFLATQMVIVTISLLFSVIVWYLMANCGLRYKVLGEKIKRIGGIKPVDGKMTNKREISDSLYNRDLVDAIESHKNLKEYIQCSRRAFNYFFILFPYRSSLTNELDFFLSKFFGVQLVTSAFCICCSLFCIVFVRTICCSW